MAECWDQMSAGMKVEVACGDEGVAKDAYWVATVIAISGMTSKAVIWLLRGIGCFVDLLTSSVVFLLHNEKFW